MEKSIKAAGGSFSIQMAPKVVTATDEADLAKQMAKAEMENAEARLRRKNLVLCARNYFKNLPFSRSPETRMTTRSSGWAEGTKCPMEKKTERERKRRRSRSQSWEKERIEILLGAFKYTIFCIFFTTPPATID